MKTTFIDKVIADGMLNDISPEMPEILKHAKIFREEMSVEKRIEWVESYRKHNYPKPARSAIALFEILLLAGDAPLRYQKKLKKVKVDTLADKAA